MSEFEAVNALREAADKWSQGDWILISPIQTKLGAAQAMTDWLRARADRLEKEAVIAAALTEKTDSEFEEPTSPKPPVCKHHTEVQHRDGKPPWCNTCGWRRAKAYNEPSVQYKVIGDLW